MRKTPVEYGTPPYAWGVASQYQCTWFAFYSCLEEGKTAPCYQDRATKSGSYNNAKTWLDNFREPWEVKDADYSPVSGDIATSSELSTTTPVSVPVLSTDPEIRTHSESLPGTPERPTQDRFSDIFIIHMEASNRFRGTKTSIRFSVLIHQSESETLQTSKVISPAMS